MKEYCDVSEDESRRLMCARGHYRLWKLIHCSRGNGSAAHPLHKRRPLADAKPPPASYISRLTQPHTHVTSFISLSIQRLLPSTYPETSWSSRCRQFTCYNLIEHMLTDFKGRGGGNCP